MIRSLDDLPDADLAGKRALVRVDYNVPLDAGRVSDATRIEASLPTLERLLGRGALPILVSHLGRPGGAPRPELSLAPVASCLAERVDAEVRFVADLGGEAAARAARELSEGTILVLENTRFLPGETANDPDLARRLAGLADVYVGDAFGTLHRAHASTVGVAAILRPAVAGLLVKNELDALGTLVSDPPRPFVAAFGGAKISDKIDLLDAFVARAETVLVGGAMANTFLRALGLPTGTSLVEEEAIDVAREVLERAPDLVRLPDDVVVTDDLSNPEADVWETASDAIPAGASAVDIGARTRASYAREICGAGSMFWNGPMGLFEDRRFAGGTFALVSAAVDATDAGSFTVIGGGDSAAAVRAAGLTARVSHVSTGGGASLQYLARGTLPGLDVLDRVGT